MPVPYDWSRHNAEREMADRLARITDEEIVNAVQKNLSEFREMLRLHHRKFYDKHIAERRKLLSRKKYFRILDKASFLSEARDLYKLHVINSFVPLPSDFDSNKLSEIISKNPEIFKTESKNNLAEKQFKSGSPSTSASSPVEGPKSNPYIKRLF